VNRFDTLRLRLPEDAVGLAARRLESHPETRTDFRPEARRPAHLLTLSGNDFLGFGFGRLQWDRLGGAVSLDVSAKCLGDSYPEGITLDTLDAFADGLNRSGFVRLTPHTLTSATVGWADVAINLPRGRDSLADDFAALRILRTSPRHRMTEPGGPVAPSLFWKGPEGKNLRAYDPEAKICTAPERPFLRSLRPETVARLSGVARFEREARGPAKVKHYLGHAVQDRSASLAELLVSDRLPVFELFENVRGQTGQRELFDATDEAARLVGLGPSRKLVGTLLRQFGWRSVCEGLGWEWEPVRDWIRVYGGKHACELYDEARGVIEAFHASPEGRRRSRLFARLDDIADALRLAA
jgi:hypothetical protein